MSESPNQSSSQPNNQEQPAQTTPAVETQADGSPQQNGPRQPDGSPAKAPPDASGQRVLIGSQRDAAAVHTDTKRDWYVPGEEKDSGQKDSAAENSAAEQKQPESEAPSAAPAASIDVEETAPADVEEIAPVLTRHFPPPNIRGQLPPELEEELSMALGDASIDDLMSGSESITSQPLLETESRHTGRVMAVQRDNVFVELGAREQGIVPLKLFDEPPQPGTELTVIVTRFNHEDGLYDLLVPNASASVSDWSDLVEGMLVDAVVTGHNSGGLECEVNKIRGFIPVSHVSLYRVENLDEFVGEKFICLVTEADADRRNLVLSRRAVLEKEQEDARKELLASLEVGQVHEGVVRKIMDFGAFVDLGGVDGLIHISQLSWGRVEHPSEVLTEGQTVKVKVLKMDETGNRISLGYRDMIESPWTDVEQKYPVGSMVKGTVTKIMEFGAFVELEPGIEGLVHISELSHKRLWRVSDAVAEGQEVDVVIKSVDAKAQRIGLSMKDALPEVKSETKKEGDEPAEPATQKALKNQKPSKPLKGGLGSGAGGEKFGLNW